ncbi:type IV pilin protein [Nesterenkonia populi]|uniref:type IV pilin protein n=1 Tax=Nesterenkonia populi TaxID=1591087 RepID=UPI0011BD68FA|nr:prepilin-type N-terminal cleavage/methylation domain-containing protein [Nesterenkonia populi]
MRKNDDSGFSLTEILVVVLMIAVLAAVAVPFYLSHVSQSRLATVEQALEDAQSSYVAFMFEEAAAHGWDLHVNRANEIALEVSARHDVDVRLSSEDGAGWSGAQFEAEQWGHFCMVTVDSVEGQTWHGDCQGAGWD